MRRRLLSIACGLLRHELTEYDFLPDVYHCACKKRQESEHARMARIAHSWPRRATS